MTTTETAIGINGMAHVMLTVSQFAAARAFYGRLLPALLTAGGAVVLWISAFHDLFAATLVNVGALTVTSIILTFIVARGLPREAAADKRPSDAYRSGKK